MIRGESFILSPEHLITFDHYELFKNLDEEQIDELKASKYFRKKCIAHGFTLISLYPIYYQGWEMDEWGGKGTKEGIVYRLETDHGNLQPERLPQDEQN